MIWAVNVHLQWLLNHKNGTNFFLFFCNISYFKWNSYYISFERINWQINSDSFSHWIGHNSTCQHINVPRFNLTIFADHSTHFTPKKTESNFLTCILACKHRILVAQSAIVQWKSPWFWAHLTFEGMFRGGHVLVLKSFLVHFLALFFLQIWNNLCY